LARVWRVPSRARGKRAVAPRKLSVHAVVLCASCFPLYCPGLLRGKRAVAPRKLSVHAVVLNASCFPL